MSKPLFKQIYETYKKYILMGVFKPGDKLPSVREVAEKMGVNPNTVNRGFILLEEEGLIETILKKGSFVVEQNNHSNLLSTVMIDIKNYKNNGVKRTELDLIIKKVYGDIDD